MSELFIACGLHDVEYMWADHVSTLRPRRMAQWCKFLDKCWRYCWWKKSCTIWYGKYPIIYRVLYIPGGAGFLPSTVCQLIMHKFTCLILHSWSLNKGSKWINFQWHPRNPREAWFSQYFFSLNHDLNVVFLFQLFWNRGKNYSNECSMLEFC